MNLVSGPRARAGQVLVWSAATARLSTMSRQVSVASMTLGIMAFVGGLCAMGFGFLGRTVQVSGLGPFSGFWGPTNYFTLGAILAIAGSGFFTFGFLNRAPKTHSRRPD